VTRLASSTVTSHWGGPGFPGDDWPHQSCYSKVRGWQNFHMDSNGWADLAYNAVACQHRFVFEGRGRGVRSAANGTTAGNSGAYAICYLGGVGDPFDEDAKAAMKAGGNWLTFAGSNRNGHRDWKATACPGDVIYNWTHAGQPIIWTPPTQPPPQEDDEMITVIAGSTDQAPRYWAALMDGYVRIFNLWDPGNLDSQTVWCPNEEYNLGVNTLYRPVKRVGDRDYDVMVASCKRRPA
jgi:hypothetical protein